jgi:starvation-inducible DNA-binding protein
MNYLGLRRERLISVVEQLNLLLASYNVYYQNLKSFHWHIQGENFFDLHDKFEILYDDAKVKIDEIAGRILTLRQKPLSNMSQYLNFSNIEESQAFMTDKEMIAETLKNLKILIALMRNTIMAANEAGDEGTIDMIGSYLAELEKASWMFDAWLSKKSEPELMLK